MILDGSEFPCEGDPIHFHEGGVDVTVSHPVGLELLDVIIDEVTVATEAALALDLLQLVSRGRRPLIQRYYPLESVKVGRGESLILNQL